MFVTTVPSLLPPHRRFLRAESRKDGGWVKMRIGKELIHSPETPQNGDLFSLCQEGGAKPALPQLQQSFLASVSVHE